jgi:alkylation response protein AidB-like acyl-CoA dehydrogenase
LTRARAPARIRFENAPAEALGATSGWSGIRRLLDRAAIVFAFEQVGAADAALEMAKEYALSRRAFGRMIGSFQAIKHKLADVYIANELARSNAYYAAWALETDAKSLPLAAATARVAATEALERAGARADPGARRHRRYLGTRLSSLLPGAANISPRPRRTQGVAVSAGRRTGAGDLNGSG